jgi:hypothetical protein
MRGEVGEAVRDNAAAARVPPPAHERARLEVFVRGDEAEDVLQDLVRQGSDGGVILQVIGGRKVGRRVLGLGTSSQIHDFNKIYGEARGKR